MTDEQNRTLLKVFPIVFLVALALVGGGLYFAAFQIDLLFHGKSARGEVLSLEAGSTTSSSGRPAWFPIVAFETPGGASITFRHRTGSNPSAYSKGERVMVTYLPDDPESALIEEGFVNWLLPVLLLIIGSGLAVISVLGIIGARRRLLKSADEGRP